MGSDPPHSVQLELVALVGPRGIWASRRDGVYRLPVLEGEGWPSMSDLQAAVGVPGAVLIGPPRRYLRERITTVHVLSDPYDDVVGGSGRGWVPLNELDALDEDPAVLAELATTVEEATGVRERPPRRPDWLRTGWFDEVDGWIGDRLRDLGLVRAGRTVTMHMWSIGTVLRTPIVDTDGSDSALVLKASCPGFASEPLITELVGSFSQGCTPEVLAVDARRSWMLMREIDDTSYETDLDRRLELALEAAPLMAGLQLAMIDHLDRLRAVGCPDRTVGPTLDALAALLDDSVELETLTPDELRLLREREPAIRDALSGLDACGIPPALVHGDLHLGNVARSQGHPVIYDWSDACIGHPFVDAAHIALRVREEDRPKVHEVFVAPWREAFPSADVDTALELALIADSVFHALSYEGIQRFQEDASRWEMAGDAAHFLRDLIAPKPTAPKR